jgi:multidrug efflux pump subunit AcrB
MTILLGLGALLTIKREIYPEVEFGWMMVTTRYPGASPEDVELNVTNKIEEELKGVDGIDRMTSYSMENVSLVYVIVDTDAPDQEEVKTEIRDAVDRVTSLPDEVTESPTVVELKSSDMPIIEVGIAGDVPYRELRESARRIEKKLKELPGVRELEEYGHRAREIRIEVYPEAARKYQIPLRDVIAAIRARNIRATAGNFESYTSDKNVVTLAQFQDPQEVGDVIVRSTFDGPVIKVKDLATVRDDFEDERVRSRMNGRPAISYMVLKTTPADAIRTSDEVKKLVESEREYLPEGVEILYSNDFARYVRNRFDVVRSNGLMGLAFVAVILSVFLSFRTAFWVALGIPVALLGTVFVMPLFGVYLDSISLSSMIMVLGIIVDDAIIIAENITRRREKGDTPCDAAVNGIHQVFLPVLTTVLTTFLAFAPMFFMTGIFGKFIFVIPVVISLALFISLGEAMVALPAHIMAGLRRASLKSAARPWFNPLRTGYCRVVRHFLRFRYLFLVLFLAILGGTLFYASSYMQFILFPSSMADQFYVMIELPIGSSLQATADKMTEIEALVAGLPEEELDSFVTRIGTNPLINAESENFGFLSVNLTPFAQRSRTADEIVEDLRGKSSQLKGYDKIIYHIESGGPPVGKPITLRVVGSDDYLRTQLADSVVAFLSTIEGVKDVERDDKLGKQQVEIKIDYEKLARLGLTVADVAQNARIAYDGEVVTSVRYGDEDVDFRVMLEESVRQREDYLRRLLIPNQQGRLIPLSEAARFEIGPGPSTYRHYNGERAITIEADVLKGTTTPVAATNAVLGRFDLDRDYPGTRFAVGGEAMETQESMMSLARTFVLAVIAIYFLLILLFNSVTQPFLVMIAIPFGAVGVIGAFALHGQPFGFVALLGFIGLAGVVVNDSLVLVSHLNSLRAQRPQEPLLDIVAEGTADRLRAIIMTTLTTVSALIPLAYGLGGSDPFMAPMALALGYGLLCATPLTLVLVPCLYVIGQDLLRIVGKGHEKQRACLVSDGGS